MKLIDLIKAEFVMLIGELKQYYMNYIFYNLSLLAMFIGLFYSFSEAKSKSALVLLFGLVLWQLCTSSLSYLSNVIEDESMLGTLEQIFMTRTSIFSVFFSKVLVNFIFSTIKAVVLFLICLLFFNVTNIFITLGIKNIFIFLIIIMCVFSFYALGLMFGGMALFFKRVSSLIQMLTYLLLFFTNITVPIERLPKWIQFISLTIPISWAAKSINLIIKGSMTSYQLQRSLIFLLLTSILLSFIGYSIFILSIKKAKRAGKLGQY